MTSETFVILVTGSRHWTNTGVIRTALNDAVRHLKPEIRIILVNGGADGADTLAANIADGLQWVVVTMNARWLLNGDAAGPIRNSEMLDLGPDVVLAFHNDLRRSKGTADLLDKCRGRGINASLYNIDGDKTVL